MADRIIMTASSSFHSYLEVAEEEGKTVLNTANGNYSFGNLHTVFEDVFKRVQIQQYPIHNILLLGLGGGSVIQLLRDSHGIEAPIKAIEIDPMVVNMAMEWFGLGQYQNVSVEITDAATYILTASAKYDLIVADIYIDLEIPNTCQNPAFLNQITALLNREGMLIYNKVVTCKRHRKEFSSIMKTLKACGDVTHYTILEANKIIIFQHHT